MRHIGTSYRSALASFSMCVFALALGTSSAWAGAGCEGASVVQHIFDSADEDGSGTLSQAEYEGAGLQDFGLSFVDSDLDGDGETSLDEYESLYEMHHPSGDEAEV